MRKTRGTRGEAETCLNLFLKCFVCARDVNDLMLPTVASLGNSLPPAFCSLWGRQWATSPRQHLL